MLLEIFVQTESESGRTSYANNSKNPRLVGLEFSELMSGSVGALPRPAWRLSFAALHST
jgi:hypothetical protein